MSEFDLRKMFESMRETLERDEAEGKLAGLGVEDLADALSHPQAPAAVAEMMQADARSVREGDPAPDFSLPWLPGSQARGTPTLKLSDHFGKRPIALVFGSYT